MKYQIHRLIGENCITPDEGQKVYDCIHPELVTDQPVELDFNGVKILAAPFFNFAIGQLYRDIHPDSLNRLLKISELNPVGWQILHQVINNSQQYYGDVNIRQAVDTVVRELAESF
ncbi:MAG: STAS-like domain-containing protein [Oscillatoriaceae cyanobacterium]